MTKNLTTLAAASSMLAVLLVAAGCTTGTTSSSPSDSPTASASAPPSSSPTEGPVDLADPSSWIIDFDGVGPLTRGASISAERASMSTAFSDGSQPEACPLVVFPPLADGVPDIWAQPGADPDISDVLVVTGNGDPAPVLAGSPRTEAGIGIGATEAELLAAYPDIASQPSEVIPDFLFYSVTDGDGTYIDFTVDPSKLVESIAISDKPVPPYEYCG